MEFYDIALAKLLQALPELANYIVTFKDASDELPEDSDTNVGIFILKSGNEYMYVPVIGKQGDIYPIDSIFISGTNKFLPLTRKTLSYIQNQSMALHSGATTIPTGAVRNPDLSQFINPPRTGKFVYSSSSRLGEFLASATDDIKKTVIEKVAAERSVFEGLNDLFGIKAILDNLKPAPQGAPAKMNQASVSVITGTQNVSDEDIQKVLNHGYVIKGQPASTRIALSKQDFATSNFTSVDGTDGNQDYELVLSDGNTREAFIPKVLAPSKKGGSVAIFTNGDYAYTETNFIAVGEPKARKEVLKTLFDFNPPVLPRDLKDNDVFAVISPDAELIGLFRASGVVINNLGIEIKATSQGEYESYTIYAYRNFGGLYQYHNSTKNKSLYIPYNSLVLILNKNISLNLEQNIFAASSKRELSTAGNLLTEQLDLGYDGIEYSINNRMIGPEAKAIEVLVVKEGIDPEKASSFIKQAQDSRFVKIYLSKSAAADSGNLGSAPAEIPSYGKAPAPTGQMTMGGNFIPNVQSAMAVGDAQAVESTIISELLQYPDMFELIDEYVPDIEECLDRLGRILLLSRVNISKLAESNDIDSIFSFLASLKAVYRMLGDNLLKLKELSQVNKQDSTVAAVGKE